MNYEEAKEILSKSQKAGKIILKTNNNWEIIYHPERQTEYENKKKLAKENFLKKQKEETLEKERLEIRKKNLQIKKRLEEKIRIERELKEKLEYEAELKRIAYEKEKAKIEQEREEKRLIEIKEENIRKNIKEKFSDARIIIQYRQIGSRGKDNQFSEWGCWITFKNETYYANHESPNRVLIANKEKIVHLKNKKDAINYCNFLIEHNWFSDTRFFKEKTDFDDFPITPPPTKEDIDLAIEEFIPYSELSQTEDFNK